MGWANCGTDSEGRPIGYAFEATCDEEGCDAEIDRGLSFACGDMHGGGENMCERYFCEAHLNNVVWADNRCVGICNECLSYVVVDDDMNIIDQRSSLCNVRANMEGGGVCDS